MCRLSKLHVRRRQRAARSQCEFEIGGVINGQIVFACQLEVSAEGRGSIKLDWESTKFGQYFDHLCGTKPAAALAKYQGILNFPAPEKRGGTAFVAKPLPNAFVKLLAGQNEA